MFVDRDGKHFRHVLNWLRDGVVPSLVESEYSELLREAEYYQLLVSSYLVQVFNSQFTSSQVTFISNLLHFILLSTYDSLMMWQGLDTF